MTEPSHFAEPSLFWQRLGQDHSADLDRYGLDQVKRHQALRYFTWRWNWKSLRESRQMRFLLRHSTPSAILRCLVERPRLSDEEWNGVPWRRRDKWLYVFAVRLLWEYARKRDALEIVSLPEPLIGSPLPVMCRGRLISQDLANTALEVAAVAQALDGECPRSILEVGGGYGRTAYALLNVFPRAIYTVVDIEPALTISRWYLTHLFPEERLRFVGPAEVHTLASQSTDLAISISSLHEMRKDQVAGYLNLFDRVSAGGIVYLKQRNRWTNPADRVTLNFDDYPIPRTWRCLFDERAPVQSDFRQAAWRIAAADPESQMA